MPKTSFRARVLKCLQKEYGKRVMKCIIRNVIGLRQPTNDLMDAVIHMMLQNLMNRRYLYRDKYRKGNTCFEQDLNVRMDAKGSPPWLTDIEFKQKYRVERSSFYRLVDLIKDHDVSALKNLRVIEEGFRCQWRTS